LKGHQKDIDAISEIFENELNGSFKVIKKFQAI
jgi:hypothetical protein